MFIFPQSYLEVVLHALILGLHPKHKNPLSLSLSPPQGALSVMPAVWLLRERLMSRKTSASVLMVTTLYVSLSLYPTTFVITHIARQRKISIQKEVALLCG